MLDIRQRFSSSRINRAWSFQGSRSIDTWTHGYHRYPAKFVPQLVKKILETYGTNRGPIADLFAGCGTTLVESKIHGKKSIGIDVNPVANLITKAKTNPIPPERLTNSFVRIKKEISTYHHDKQFQVNKHPRVEYWFRKRERNKIAFLLDTIGRLRDSQLRNFYLCALSNVLKNSSKWLQSSTKPQIDPEKVPTDPFSVFLGQVQRMMVKNKLFYESLKVQGFIKTECSIRKADARRTGLRSASIGMIITSPPYVTSYEYADIHQLTAYWFGFTSDIAAFRKRFIGTFYSQNKTVETDNLLAQEAVDRLKMKDVRTAREVARYFDDMGLVAAEMMRILKKGGKACLVIGNTTLKGVKIRSAEIIASILEDSGFVIKEIIHRSIPHKHKQIPTIRNKKTGRFAKLSSKNSKLVYPNEYIIVAEK